MHDEDIERMTSDLLRFGVGKIVGGKWNLFRSHVRLSQSIRLALQGRFSLRPHRAAVTVHNPMRSGDVSLHERQNTVKSLFEASGSDVPTSQIGYRSPRPLPRGAY